MRADLQRLKRDSESGRVPTAISGPVTAADTSAFALTRPTPQGMRKKVALRALLAALLAVGLAGLIGTGLFYYLQSRRESKRLTDNDTIVLADFANSTGDAVFDDTLKTALNISLRQSPFLNILSDSNAAKTLKLMARPAGHKIHARCGPRGLPTDQ